MAAKSPPSDLPIYSFGTIADLEFFLEREHATSPGFHLKLARKSCKAPSVKTAEALQVALCYGWINGQGNSFDEDWYLARYTPRRPNSTWSKVNVDLVEKLTQEGRMRPAGLAAVEAAKADGRWDRAYAAPSKMIVPADFLAALSAESNAAIFFEGLNKTDRYLTLLPIEIASPQNRATRIRNTIAMLAIGKKPGASHKAKAKAQETSKPQGVQRTRGAKATSARPAKPTSSSLNTKDVSPERPRRPGLRARR